MDYHKRLEELAVVHSARDIVERLVRSIVGQSIKALNAFLNEFDTKLVHRLRIRLASRFVGSQLAVAYMVTQFSGVGETRVEVQSPARPDREGEDAAATSPSRPARPNPSTPPTKQSHDHSKMAGR